MKIARTIAEMKEMRQQLTGTVGFVPTMGYLHEGHTTLVRVARSENDAAVVSIFVNPTQFGPKEDFAKYPRDTERDLAMLEKVKTDIVFMPEVTDMYPATFNSWVVLEGITGKLEGASRPGHFKGVTTVVAKLFNITEPTRAYFGQKDAQQLLVIRKMVADLNMNLDVITVPTVREPDGLAMSSRNVYLNPVERQGALVLWKSLQLAQKLWDSGERDGEQIRSQMIGFIQNEPLAQIDYISVADTESLEELKKLAQPPLVSLAVRFGKTRLIDNKILEGPA
ncbi:MAG: pantoate--beta-alanine ligase [Dehalococcoidia bacterium]|nr:pantoate--beta-alanine ligase [Dehalococcoidia bacterium]